MPTVDNIGAWLREARKSSHLTLHDVSDASGVSVSYLSDLERGKTLPTLGALQQIADAYGAAIYIDMVFADDEHAPDMVTIPRRDLLDIIQQIQKLSQHTERKEQS